MDKVERIVIDDFEKADDKTKMELLGYGNKDDSVDIECNIANKEWFKENILPTDSSTLGLRMIPNSMGYVFIRPIQIKKKDGLFLPEGKSLNELRVGKVISKGLFEDEYILYQVFRRKIYKFNNEDLHVIMIHDIISLFEIDEDLEAIDIIQVDLDAKCYDSGNNHHGDPEIIKI